MTPRPFADAVRAGVGSVMCSYNKINGSYSCENEWTTNYLLKNELNFQGFGMSTQCFPSPFFRQLDQGH
jgi:beta-glucosidase